MENEPSDEFDTMAATVRFLVSRELTEMKAKLFLSDEDVDKLAKLALVMQRIGVKASGAAPGGELTGEQLMRRANG